MDRFGSIIILQVLIVILNFIETLAIIVDISLSTTLSMFSISSESSFLTLLLLSTLEVLPTLAIATILRGPDYQSSLQRYGIFLFIVGIIPVLNTILIYTVVTEIIDFSQLSKGFTITVAVLIIFLILLYTTARSLKVESTEDREVRKWAHYIPLSYLFTYALQILLQQIAIAPLTVETYVILQSIVSFVIFMVISLVLIQFIRVVAMKTYGDYYTEVKNVIDQ